MITKSPAVVLRAVDYKESSLIVTLFTQRHGKIAVIARGARKPPKGTSRSKFAALLVPGQVLEVVYYMKTTRSVQTLSDASAIYKLDKFRTDLQKMALVSSTLELVSQILHEHEENQPIFSFLCKLLPWMNERENVSKQIFPYIQIRLAHHSGIGLQALEETGTSAGKGYINIPSGSLSLNPEGEQSIALTPSQFAFVRESLHSKKSSIFEIDLKKNELNELIEYLDKYLRYHIDGVRPRKSDGIFEQLFF